MADVIIRVLRIPLVSDIRHWRISHFCSTPPVLHFHRNQIGVMKYRTC
jgi:hypothetical protein